MKVIRCVKSTGLHYKMLLNAGNCLRKEETCESETVRRAFIIGARFQRRDNELQPAQGSNPEPHGFREGVGQHPDWREARFRRASRPRREGPGNGTSEVLEAGASVKDEAGTPILLSTDREGGSSQRVALQDSDTGLVPAPTESRALCCPQSLSNKSYRIVLPPEGKRYGGRKHEIVKLLTHGADPNAKAKDGRSPRLCGDKEPSRCLRAVETLRGQRVAYTLLGVFYVTTRFMVGPVGSTSKRIQVHIFKRFIGSLTVGLGGLKHENWFCGLWGFFSRKSSA